YPHFQGDHNTYNWITPAEFCPRIGIRMIHKGEFCAFFSLLWIYLRIHCSTIEREKLHTALVSGGPEFLAPLILGIQCKLQNHRDYLEEEKMAWLTPDGK